MKHSVQNILFGVLEQIVTIVLTFATRTVFIKVLDDHLLGVNGLFSNILSLLSLAELGFGTAIIYGMYKPIAKNDTKKIAALMNYYRKVYNVLAVIIILIGLAFVPFLKNIVNSDIPINHLLIYYLIFLSDAVCSYILANRTAIIEANQNYYIIKRYNTCFIILKNILQIIVLITLKNFIVYLLIQVFITFLTNVYGAMIAKKKYPYAFEKVELEKEEKKSLIENVKSMVIYKIGGVLMNHTDEILISVLEGTINVGYYSNYNMIVYSITRFTGILFNSIKASVGNLNVSDNKEKKINIFNRLSFLVDWVYGFVAVALFVLLNEFITLWIGETYIFSTLTVFAIVLKFYIKGLINTVSIYRDTTGLFRQTKYVYLVAAILNIVCSIILGKLYGVFGILIATSIAMLLTNFWFEPYMLFKQCFEADVKPYFVARIKNFGLIIIASVVLWILFQYIELIQIHAIIIFIIEVCITAIIPNLLFLLAYFKKDEFQYYRNLMYNFLREFTKKRNR